MTEGEGCVRERRRERVDQCELRLIKKRKHWEDRLELDFSEGKCHCSNFTSRGHICANNQAHVPDSPKYTASQSSKERVRQPRLNILSLIYPVLNHRRPKFLFVFVVFEGKMVVMMKSPLLLMVFH